MPMPFGSTAAAEQLFRHKVIAMLREEGLLTQERIELLPYPSARAYSSAMAKRTLLALYDIEIEDGILNENVRPFPGAPFTIPSYRNAPETRHRGLELGLDGLAARDAFQDGDRITWRAAYTYSDFRFVDDPQFGDNDLPGAPPQVLHAEVAYRHAGGWWLAPRVEWVAEDSFADSANTQEAEGYTLLDLAVGHAWERWELLVSGTNLTDEFYAASVQVDNALGRYLEPGPGRAAAVTVRWRR